MHVDMRDVCGWRYADRVQQDAAEEDGEAADFRWLAEGDAGAHAAVLPEDGDEGAALCQSIGCFAL